jgi:hypothetical protein
VFLRFYKPQFAKLSGGSEMHQERATFISTLSIAIIAATVFFSGLTLIDINKTLKTDLMYKVQSDGRNLAVDYFAKDSKISKGTIFQYYNAAWRTYKSLDEKQRLRSLRSDMCGFMKSPGTIEYWDSLDKTMWPNDDGFRDAVETCLVETNEKAIP